MGSEQRGSEKYDVFSPEGFNPNQTISPSKPLNGLANSTIALVWDYVFRGDEVFELVQAEVERSSINTHFVSHDHFGNIHGPEEREVVAALPKVAQAAGCNGAVLGMGC